MPKEIIKRIRKLEIKTKGLVDGLLQGAYHSIFKGRGIEFSEVRPYQFGDDVRSIDWNVTARTNEPHIKEFIEERDLTIYLVFDVSSSNDFGNLKEKKEHSYEIAASLMFAALRNNDKIGLALFSNQVETFFPARKGKKHIFKLLLNMIKHKAKPQTTDINKTLSDLEKIIKKRSIIFVISDFQSEDFTNPLRILKTKHDVILINVHDIREKEIPDIGYIRLEDEETGEQVLVDTSDIEFQKQYKKIIQKQTNEFKRKMNANKIDIIQLCSDETFDIPLRRFFNMRMRRVGVLK